MAQTAAGARLASARRVGVTVEEYQAILDAGYRWCTRCKTVQRADEFGSDATRPDGMAAACRASRKAHYDRTYVSRAQPGPRRYGPPPNPPRDDDRRQARQRINVEVQRGRRPAANSLPCVDCGHVWSPGERRHEYDHHLGYAAEHHYDVEVVCTTCHHARSERRGETRHRSTRRQSVPA